MRPLQQDSQEIPRPEELTLVILNHTAGSHDKRTTRDINTDSSHISIFPTGTISLWLLVLIILPAPFHSVAKCSVIVIKGRERRLCSQLQQLCCSAEEQLSRHQLSSHSRGSESSCLANRTVITFSLVSWVCSQELGSTEVWGAAVQSGNLCKPLGFCTSEVLS